MGKSDIWQVPAQKLRVGTGGWLGGASAECR